MATAQSAPSNSSIDRTLDSCINQYNNGQLTADCYYVQQMAYLGLHYDRFVLTKGAVIPADTLIVYGQNTVTLNGLKSSDPNNDKLSYSWTQTAGEPVQFSSTTDPTINFVAPSVDQGQVKLLRVNLKVDDGHGLTDSTYINIIVVHVNRPPVVQVVSPITVDEGSPVNLSCSATDPDNDKLSYAWGQFSGQRVQLSSYSDTNPTFTAPIIFPATAATQYFMCSADDGHGGKSTATVVVNIKSTHQTSTLTCEDISALENNQVTLSPTIVNPNNDVLSYQWKQISGQPVALSSTTALNPTFTAPSYSATGNQLKFQLDVTGGVFDLRTCQMTVTISKLPIQIEPPVANAGLDKTVNGGIQVILDGSASTGKHLTYSWKQTGGDTVTLLFANTAHPVFFAPSVDIDKTKVLEFTLTVSNEGGTDSDSVKITVVNANQPPTAVITPQ